MTEFIKSNKPGFTGFSHGTLHIFFSQKCETYHEKISMCTQTVLWNDDSETPKEKTVLNGKDKVFLLDFRAASRLVSQNNETATMLLYQTNPPGVELICHI